VDDIIKYRFRSEKLRNKATLAAGAPVSDVNVDGNKQGNKDLALVGDALIRLAIVDQGYAEGARTGKEQVAVWSVTADRTFLSRGTVVSYDLGRFVVKNPCQGKVVSRTTMASTVEALVGAVWLDSGRNFEQVRAVMKRLGIIDDARRPGY
ncbi:hypothetical protein B0T21DRAFT_288200, partial [Apiosordaria backusii]